MIDQILQLHPGSSWLHVGGDEVWNLKTCSKCKNNNESNSDIFLGHMIPVLEYVKQHSKTPIMWDDMMRDWDLNKLIRMGQLAEPMLWGYRTPLSQHFPKDTWSRYNTAFKRVWMASAFKGAFKSNADYVKIDVRVQNNLDWVHAASNLPNVTVAGLALTGWSRYRTVLGLPNTALFNRL
ncbi:Hexosaminidase D [Exaiptasia diaphana]|nr:Hexosaminidase D [Exaiptasia diaphana]